MAELKKKKKRRASDDAADAHEGGGEEAVETEAPMHGKQRKVVNDSSEKFGDRRSVSGRGSGAGGRGYGGGGGSGSQPEHMRPSSLKMLRKNKGRKHTLSVALPASIVENAQSDSLKAFLVGQIARALTIFTVDEVILYEDQSGAPKSEDADGASRGLAFFARVLQYLETPQYLRKQLLPFHRDLRQVGLLAPLDAPHHLRRHEKLAYREGAVLPADQSPKPLAGEKGCWVDVGTNDPVWLDDQEIPEGIRVTVRLDEDNGEGDAWNGAPNRGSAVAPDEPRKKCGFYWGYQTRIATSFKKVFDECPFDDGYDLRIGTSERGEAVGVSRVPHFKHLLLVLGGLGGLEEAINDEGSGYEYGTDPSTLFQRYINICPEQTSRTIRTEEALLITLTALRPHLP